MKILIAYFYQIRFFSPNMIPLSTATWDPKWYHDFKGQNHIYKDKNGVFNGLRYELLNPSQVYEPHMCPCEDKNPHICAFLNRYVNYIRSIPKTRLWADFEAITANYRKATGVEPVIVLIFHEKPDNPCSERWGVISYLKECGFEVEDFIVDKTK